PAQHVAAARRRDRGRDRLHHRRHAFEDAACRRRGHERRAGGRLPVGVLGLRSGRPARAVHHRSTVAPQPDEGARRCGPRCRDRRCRLMRSVVHLELHTGHQAAASAFYTGLLGWTPELVESRCGSYLALDLGHGLGGGIVQCRTERPRWLPYVEDALQETLLRAWRALPRFEERSSLRSWLYTIATNVCLRAIERRPKRVLPIDYGPASDPHDAPAEAVGEAVWLEPYPDSDLGF